MKIKSLGVAGFALAGALVLAAGSAQADGMRDRSYAPPPAPIWNGLYVGADVGFAYAEADLSIDTNFAGSYRYSGESDNQMVGGLLVGYNMQRGSTVMGIEGDINFIDGDGLDSLSSIRGRYGIVNGGWLIYGTAGIGFLSGDFDTQTGWVAGGGFETKLSPNMTVGFEGLYYGFPEEEVTVYNTNGAYAHATLDWNVVSFRGRMTYQLDRGYDRLK